MGVSLSDTGQEPIVPNWVAKLDPGFDISFSTEKWIKESKTLYYAFHGYTGHSHLDTAKEIVDRVNLLSQKWNCPSFATEFGGCQAWTAFAAANISHSYWHYSGYCNTGPDFGNRKVPEDTFGGCMLGWASGDSNFTCP